MLVTLSLLLFFPNAMATSIFAVRNDNEIVIGGDSKKINLRFVGGDVSETDAGSACKIVRTGELFIATAGLSSYDVKTFDTASNYFDIKKYIAQSVPFDGTIKRKADVIEKAISDLLDKTMEIMIPDIDTQKETTDKYSMIDVILAGVENESLKLIRIYFKASRLPSGKIDVKSHRIECPGDCPANGTFWVSIGASDVIKKYLDENRAFLANNKFIDATRKLIEMEISEHPSAVGGPIDILRITKNGYEWVLRKNTCADYDKAIEIKQATDSVHSIQESLRATKEGHARDIAEFNKAIKINPKSGGAYMNRGFFYQERKQYDLALADFSKAIELNPMDEFAYINRAMLYESRKQYELVIADYSSAITLNPRNWRAYNTRGWIYHFIKKDFDKATADYTKAIELNPQFDEAYYYRGVIYEIRKQYDSAFADFSKALEMNPRNERAYNSRGWLYYRIQKDPDKAIADLTKAIELNSNLVAAYINRGNVFANKKLDDEALADFNKAIELNPTNERAYYIRGWLYHYKKKDYDNAIVDYTKAIELNSKFDSAYINRGNVFINKKLEDRALADFNRAIELNPKSSFAYYDKARLYAIENNIEKACTWFKKAISLGYDRWDHIKQDKDLNAIRDLSCYREIMTNR